MSQYVLACVDSQKLRYPLKSEVLFEGTQEECIAYCNQHICSSAEQTQLAYDFSIFTYVLIKEPKPASIFLIKKEHDYLLGTDGNPTKDILRNLDKHTTYKHGYTFFMLFSDNQNIDVSSSAFMQQMVSILTNYSARVLTMQALNGATTKDIGDFMGMSVWASGNMKSLLTIWRRQAERMAPWEFVDDIFLPIAKSLIMFDMRNSENESEHSYSTLLKLPKGLCYLCAFKVPENASIAFAAASPAWKTELEEAKKDTYLWELFGIEDVSLKG